MSKTGKGVVKKAAKKTTAKARALELLGPLLGPHDTVMAVQEVLKPLLRAKAPGVYQRKGLNGAMDADYAYGPHDFEDLLDRELPEALANNGYTFKGAPDEAFINAYLHATAIVLVPAVAARTTYP
jgi:hypothetical protein